YSPCNGATPLSQALLAPPAGNSPSCYGHEDLLHRTVLILPPTKEFPMSQAKLILHCGAREVTRAQLDRVPCPAAEGSWKPVPRGTVLTYATQALTDAGYQIEKLQLGLSRNDARFFGTLTLRSAFASGIALAVGLCNSINKSIRLQYCCGHHVMVFPG